MAADILQGLNERQIEAVTATEGYVRIIAGAGSGKTKALTNRYAYLAVAAGIPTGNILCVTFTNKAAGEMKKRVRALIGDGFDGALITTYHGFCVRVLREHIGRLFYPENFSILDKMAQKTILEEIYTELELKLDHASFERILDLIDKRKSNSAYVDLMISRDADAFGQPADLDERIIAEYMRRQKKIFGLDFNDLINFVFVLFERFPEVKRIWQEKLEYIQVDEFQDSSSRELKLINLLSEVKRNLFVVGDPDQNIYEWRGARVEILVDFDRSHPDTKTVIMDQNYRSTGNILTAANTLIDFNKNRIKKSLFTTGEKGEEVVHLHAKNEGEECRWISNRIAELNREGVPYSGVAVLYRASFLSRSIEQAFMSAGIPYEIVGSSRFFRRMEILDALAYLRLIESDDDDALARIINTPRRTFGRKKLALLKDLAADAGVPLYEALKLNLGLPDFARSRAKELIDAIEKLREMKETAQVSELLSAAMLETGYEKYIREVGSMERLENLGELKKIALEQERSWGENYPLYEFLSQIALMSRDDSESELDRVKLMTIHAAKGLEFPVCFVIGMTDGIFPSARTMEERGQAGLEEERRLCFVALTRAMKQLYLTDSEGTGQTGGGSSYKKLPSRFLFEIGEQNYRRIGVISKELTDEARKKPSVMPDKPRLKAIGERVQHSVFGNGVIESVDERKGVYQIRFDRSGALKPISTAYDFDAWEDVVSSLNAKRDAAAARPVPAKEDTPSDAAVEAPKYRFTTPEQDSELPPVLSLPDTASELFARDTALNDAQTDASGEINGGSENITDIAAKEDGNNDNPVEVNDDAPLEVNGDVPVEVNDDVPVEVNGDAPLEVNDDVPLEVGDDAPVEITDDAPDDGVADEEDITDDEFDPDYDGNNLWKRADVPHSGWHCVGITDLGSPSGTCGMCGRQIIRYVHHMRHPDYPREIGAGCVCAGRMEGDPDAARVREAEYKKAARASDPARLDREREKRRAAFIARPRKMSKNGNEYIKYKDEIFTIIRDRRNPGKFKAVYNGSYTQPCPSVEAALSAVFDMIDK